MFETTADVEIVTGAAKVGGEGGGGPDRGCGEKAGEDCGRFGCFAADDRDGRATERSDRGGFFRGVAEPLAGEGRFDFEHGVHAFGGQVESGGMRKERRRIEVVEDGDVDLAGAVAGGVDYKGGGGSVTLGEIAIEKLEPVMLGGCSGGGCVLKESADGELGEHFLLDAAEDVGEVDLAGVGSAGHDGLRVAEQIAGGARRKREVVDRRSAYG